MHLGRFHATIYDLAQHFTAADLPAKLEQCAAALDQYAQTRAQPQLDAFRIAYEKLLQSSHADDSELEQPYAHHIIVELSLQDILAPLLPATLQQIVHDRAFDHAGIATDFRALSTKLSKKAAQLIAIDKAFSELEVEFERVRDSEAEVGILLPREVVGESLTSLTSEFSKLGKLFHAISELTGAHDYEPRVRTISSSWWQVFLDLDPNQVLVWVVAVERIVTLFKSNLEIKDLQKRLSSNDMPQEITDLIEKEIDRRIDQSLASLASEIRRDHAKIDDEARLNEVEIQLRHGLRHLAMRINQGSQVEINVAVPDAPKEPGPPVEGEEQDIGLQAQITEQRAKISQLRELRNRSQLASTETLRIGGESQVLLRYFADRKDVEDTPPSGA